MAKCDMLVRLYDIPLDNGYLNEQQAKGVIIRKPIAPEMHKIIKWATQIFSPFWGSEVAKAIANTPVSCFIALKDGKLVGFACYDATALGFFGPTGVSEECRGMGTGKALLMAALQDMRAKGYGYAIIGAVGPAEFYAKAVGATEIAGSEDSIYASLLRQEI